MGSGVRERAPGHRRILRLNHFLTIRLTRPPCPVNLRSLVIFIGINLAARVGRLFLLPHSIITSRDATSDDPPSPKSPPRLRPQWPRVIPPTTVGTTSHKG